MTLQSTAGAAATIIDGDPWGARGVLINGVNATLHDFTIRNGYADATYGGGGVLCYGAGRVLNCVVEGCWSDSWGGGIYGYYGGYISNTLVQGNGAEWNGGGIGLAGSAPVVDSCVVSYNLSGEYGGGIHFDGGGNVRSTRVTHNRSVRGGGMAFFWSGTATACQVAGNLATNGDGGGIFFYQGGAVLNSTNSHNSAADQGGGVFFDNGGRLSATVVISNTAQTGGGLFISTNGLADTGCLITGNLASNGGGGVVMDSGGTVEGCAMNYNTAVAFGGGGAVLYQGELLTQCDVIGNRGLDAEAIGGGVYVHQSGVADHCYIISNQVPHGGGGGVLQYGGILKNSDVYWNLQTTAGYGNGGGGILCYEGGAVSNCWIVQNDSAEAGGGVFCSRTGTVIACHIINNNADTLGGGVAGDFGGRLDRCTISWNQCGGLGGGVFFDDRGGIVQNCMITHNLAVTNGGGLFFDEEKGSLINCTVVANLAGNAGAGLYGKTNLLVRNSIVYYNTNFAAGAWRNYYIEPGSTGVVFSSVCTDPVPVPNALNIGCFAADPMLVLSGEGDYLLPSSSPCVDAGEAAGGPALDRFGTPRPLDGNHDGTSVPDIGAHEWVDSLADSDADGLKDADEIALGTSPVRPDTDGDGSSDADEVQAGTDPLNSTSVFALGSATRPAGAMTIIRWASATGKWYALSVSTNLLTGFSTQTVHVAATPPQNTYTDTVSSARSQYYRVEVE